MIMNHLKAALVTFGIAMQIVWIYEYPKAALIWCGLIAVGCFHMVVYYGFKLRGLK